MDEKQPPNLPAQEAVESVDQGRRQLNVWLWRLPVLVAIGGGIYGVREIYRHRFAKPEPSLVPAFEEREPVAVAALDDFAADWDAVPFVLGGVPCLAMRLPNAIPGSLALSLGEGDEPTVAQDPSGTETTLHLAAFSRVCTHQQCLVDLSLDPEVVAFAYNHRSELPSLTCPCHYSVFDPSLAGRAVSGPAMQPLPRARLSLRRDDTVPLVWADGIEPAPPA